MDSIFPHIPLNAPNAALGHMVGIFRNDDPGYSSHAKGIRLFRRVCLPLEAQKHRKGCLEDCS